MAMNQSVVSEKLRTCTRGCNKSEAITKQLRSAGGEWREISYRSLCKFDRTNDRVADLEKEIKAVRDKLDDHEKNIGLL